MGSSPSTPAETTEEKAAARRQSDEAVRLDEEENERVRRLKRSRYAVTSNAVQSQVGKSTQQSSGGSSVSAQDAATSGRPSLGGSTAKKSRGS